MKRRILVLAAGIAAALAGALPASASDGLAAVGVFVGEAELTQAGDGFGYPVSPECGTPVGVCPNGDTGRWTLKIESGTSAAVAVRSGAQVSAGPLSGEVSGQVGPGAGGIGAFCGYSSGSAGATAADKPITVNDVLNTPAHDEAVHVSGVRWVQSAATVIVYDNIGSAGATIVGVVSAIPPAPVVSTASCLNRSATTFTVVGAAAVVVG